MKIEMPTRSQVLRLAQLAQDEPGTKVVGIAACPILRMEDNTLRYVAPNGRVLILGRINRATLDEHEGRRSRA